MDVISTLSQLDREMFTFIHSTASSPYLDWLMKALRNAVIWIPLYVFVLYWIVKHQKNYAWQFILFTLVVFAITDFTSASIMKPFFARPRPCYTPELQPILRNLIGCGGKYGMPSSHASNHFGLAAFWYFSISWMSNRKWTWLWIWAFAIVYAQVYVGKHFPGDVIVGAFLGTAVGFLLALLFRKWLLNAKSNETV